MSDEAVVNEALVLLTGQGITSLAGRSKAEQAAAVLFESSRDAVLELANWKFAQHYQSLSVDPDNRYGGLLAGTAATYNLPADYIRGIELNSSAAGAQDWDVIGQYVVTSAGVAVLRYIRRVEDVTKWAPLFRKALAAYLAQELAFAIPEHTAKYDRMTALFDDRMEKASGMNAFVGRQREFRTTRAEEMRARR